MNAAAISTAAATSDQKKRFIIRVAEWLISSPLRLCLIPYLVGVVWHSLHPVASILTGDLHNPRRWYIDENSLDPGHFQTVSTKYDLVDSQRQVGQRQPTNESKSWCDELAGGWIPCHRHVLAASNTGTDRIIGLEIAKITPLTAGVSPVSEAIVLVVPPLAIDQTNLLQFQTTLLQLMQRLASPQTSPWLAKTVLVVSPLVPSNMLADSHTRESMSPLLEETVRVFLDSHLGVPGGSTREASHNQLSVDFMGGCMLRTLLVLDLDDAKDNGPEVRILPQGRRGLLPNMDLTFLVKAVLDRSNMVQQSKVELFVHPYHRAIETWWTTTFEPNVPEAWEDSNVWEMVESWAHKLLHLVAFESILAVGPYPPHSPALVRGIDAVTIQGSFSEAQPQYTMEMISRMEVIIRALSNLQERLHHSTSLYLLTSKDRFVKHEEYLVPNLLLVIPLILRALCLVLRTDDSTASPFRPRVATVVTALTLTAVWTMVATHLVMTKSWSTADPTVGLALHLETMGLPCHPALWCYVLVLLLLALFHTKMPLHLTHLDSRRSLQFATCLVAACMHVSIAFGHVALAYPSALMWTPLLAFPTVETSGKSSLWSTIQATWAALIHLVLAVVLCPFVLLVPHVFATYTPYVRFLYIPLHFLYCLLHAVPLGQR